MTTLTEERCQTPSPEAVFPAVNDAADHRAPHMTKKQIRGSSLLLFGRLISMALNLATQVLLARLLTKHEFGAFSYALAAVALGSSFVSLGLDKSARRFLPIFHEQGDFRRLLGTILLSLASILAMGVLLVTTLYALHDFLLQNVITDPLTLSLTLVLIALAPVEALNRLCIGMVATFAGTRAIFWRQHVIGPALKLAIVAALMFGSSPYVLVGGYLAAGIVGTMFYAAYLLRVLRRMGLWKEMSSQPCIIPARDVLSYSLPLLSSDLASAGRAFLAVYFLGVFHGPSLVAVFRVVVPIAGLNKVIFETFQFLFMPIASRLFARGDELGIHHLYWRTSLWMTVLTFPIFLVTFVAAEPLTVLIVGPKYREAGTVMAWLSLGYFLNTALGFNALTLKVFGDIRRIVTNDLSSVAVTLALNYLLVPTYGASGAAIANCLAIVIHNLLNQWTLVRMTGIHFFPRGHLKLYLAMILTTVALVTAQGAWTPPILVSIAFAGAAGLGFAYCARGLLDVDEMFPEIARLPLIGRFICAEVTP